MQRAGGVGGGWLFIKLSKIAKGAVACFWNKYHYDVTGYTLIQYLQKKHTYAHTRAWHDYLPTYLPTYLPQVKAEQQEGAGYYSIINIIISSSSTYIPTYLHIHILWCLHHSRHTITRSLKLPPPFMPKGEQEAEKVRLWQE